MTRDTTRTAMLALSATLVLPACRNDEATQVPDTQTPYMEAPDERPLERDEDAADGPMEGPAASEPMQSEPMDRQ
jgi:hypothetical protein